MSSKAEQGKRIDPRYILPTDIDPAFREEFIEAPTHLEFPTKNHYAFLKGIIGTDPAKDKVACATRVEHVMFQSDGLHRGKTDAIERPLTNEEVREFFQAAITITGKRPATLEDALVIVDGLNESNINMDDPGLFGEPFGEQIPDTSVDTFKQATRGDLRNQMESILSVLSPKERTVLEERFGLRDGKPKTLEEVGRIFGVTRERIRQIEGRALGKIRDIDQIERFRLYL